MPAVEASEEAVERELAAYELAFHVLPTIAEGEVEGVFATLKEEIKKAGGEIFDEEAPLRFDLAYEISKYVEGRNRTFGSAYFGWVRFRIAPQTLEVVTESVEGTKELLRYLLIRLTRAEEAAPFRFHTAIAEKRVRTIGATDEVVEAEEVVAEVVEGEVEKLEEGAVTDGGETKE